MNSSIDQYLEAGDTMIVRVKRSITRKEYGDVFVLLDVMEGMKEKMREGESVIAVEPLFFFFSFREFSTFLDIKQLLPFHPSHTFFLESLFSLFHQLLSPVACSKSWS